MDEQDIQKTALYANYAKKLSSIGMAGSKALDSTAGQQAFGTMGKGASGLLAAYSAYRIAQGQGNVGDYASVGSQAAKLAGVGKSIVPYAGAALGIYNIAKTGEVNSSDVVGLAPALLNAGASGAAAAGAGTVGTAGAAGTGVAGGLGAGAAAAGTAALGYAAARLGGMAAGAMNDKWFNNKAVPLQHLEGSLKDPFAVENYWGKQLAAKGIGSEKLNHALMSESNPLEIGSWMEKGSLRGKVEGTLNPLGGVVSALSKSDQANLKKLGITKDTINMAGGGLGSISQIGKSKEATMGAIGNILSGGLGGAIKGLFGGRHEKSKTDLKLDAQYKYLKENGLLDEKALKMGRSKWRQNVKSDIHKHKKSLGKEAKNWKIDWNKPITDQLGESYGQSDLFREDGNGNIDFRKIFAG
jgi:hypothetical protein